MNFKTLPALVMLPVVAAVATACAHLPGADASLTGTQWQLVQLGDNTTLAHEQRREPTLRLDADTGRVSGSAGCNRFMGSYSLNGNRIDFSQMAATQMACAQGMDTERAYLQALTRVQTWKVQDGQLNFYSAGDEPVATFVAPN